MIARIVNRLPAVIAQRAGGKPASSVLHSATKFCCGSSLTVQRPQMGTDLRSLPVAGAKRTATYP